MCEVCGGKTRNKRLATEQFQDICVYMQYNLTKVDITIKTLQVETQGGLEAYSTPSDNFKI